MEICLSAAVRDYLIFSNLYKERNACWQLQDTHVSRGTGFGFRWCRSGLPKYCAGGEILQALDCPLECQRQYHADWPSATQCARLCFAPIDRVMSSCLRKRANGWHVEFGISRCQSWQRNGSISGKATSVEMVGVELQIANSRNSRQLCGSCLNAVFCSKKPTEPSDWQKQCLRLNNALVRLYSQ